MVAIQGRVMELSIEEKRVMLISHCANIGDSVFLERVTPELKHPTGENSKCSPVLSWQERSS